MIGDTRKADARVGYRHRRATQGKETVGQIPLCIAVNLAVLLFVSEIEVVFINF